MTYASQQRHNRVNYSSQRIGSGGRPTMVPNDLVRVHVSAPCVNCGAAREPCRHRPWIEGEAA